MAAWARLIGPGDNTIVKVFSGDLPSLPSSTISTLGVRGALRVLRPGPVSEVTPEVEPVTPEVEPVSEPVLEPSVESDPLLLLVSLVSSTYPCVVVYSGLPIERVPSVLGCIGLPSERSVLVLIRAMVPSWFV